MYSHIFQISNIHSHRDYIKNSFIYNFLDPMSRNSGKKNQVLAKNSTYPSDSDTNDPQIQTD